ncbi:uncharacterized protein BXZ73DRAFT_90731 [Epithele typhae]|uniref:uncharacterized protein n=1 Tax=Epithele typhae TaxID=378194 RepID=UPI0020079FFB|nr:uncharacterized protein BXZ73DRAFT_90731 [Epithele typhae]KAH9927459.1 hypothetical protein BXZ73DRAFT_90731 [Epithele typhae]
MTTTTMHFGPEWMRTKQGSSRPAPSPPLANSTAPPGNSTYSALVTPATAPPQEGRDVAHPFRYSKEEMLRIYKEGGGRGGLGLEVERWEGIVREVGYEPAGLKEMGDAEKKLFAGQLNSEVRRRQSTDFLSPLTTANLGDRPKLAHASPGAASPMRERIGNFMGARRRGDSTDQAPLALPRKLSLSNMQNGLASPREGGLPSPRVRAGFDGVLNDSWTARRRASENAPKNKSEKEGDGEPKDPHIKEEEEEPPLPSERSRETTGSSTGQPLNGNVGANKATEQINGQVQETSISGQSATGAPAPPKPPADLSKVEWSYLDPQGRLQGPFMADVMQGWHEQGYFQPALLMKRTHLDAEFTPMGELLRRAAGQPVFLSPLVHEISPPGLTRPIETVVDRAIPERLQHSPYQPVPTRSLRSSTLDSYLQNGSAASESPSSSFGGRLVNASPDTGGQAAYEQPTESRMPFASSAIGTPGQRRATMQDPVEQIFTNRGFGMGRGSGVGIDALGFNGTESPSTFDNNLGSSPFGQRLQQEPGPMNGMIGSSALNGTEFGPIGGIHSNQGIPSRVLNRDSFGKPALDEMVQPGLGGGFSNHNSPFVPHAQPFSSAPLSPFAGQENRAMHSMTPITDRQPNPFQQHFPQQPFTQSPSYGGTAHSPWHAPDQTLRRPVPFEPALPVGNNGFPVQPTAPPQPFTRTISGISVEQSPWPTPAQPAQPVANDPWSTPTASLTAANLDQHDQQQRQAELQQHVVPEPTPEATAPVAEEPRLTAAPSAPTPSEPSPTEPSSPQKSKRKSAGQQASAPAAKATASTVAAPLVPLAKPPSPVPAPESKPVVPWAIDDDKKAKPSGINLREIQEAEAKKEEARKAAQRERERAARVSSQLDDAFQPVTSSWGLPTSLAGAGRGNAKEGSSAATAMATGPASTTPAPAVWTNATKVPAAKKTMKEIQEEEERRKKQAKEKEALAATMATAARRAYADSTKPAAATPPAPGGAWAVVGSNGKAPAVVVTARPAGTPTPAATKATPVIVSAVVAPAATRPATSVQAPRPAATPIKATPSKEEPAVAPGPSLEFLKWMHDSLKGLNNSVQLEELSYMLLAFPLDPDPSTIEIISDLIYASSTTLDGRRFANDFVSRRKADATSRKGAAAASVAKGLSIADVVKTQPKPAQNEWGGFKVVNKKKKGGRA